MRVDLKYIVYVGLMVMILSLSSCQKEKHVVIQDEEQEESLIASSETINLLARTSSNDGSWDNIIDSCSCFDVNFPYTVWANETEIEIESKADLIQIEEIFDAIDTDSNSLIIDYPITVVMGDYTEVIIDSKDEMLALAKLCQEGGIDDDIECIDIVYPITIYSFDTNIQILDNYTLNNDFELRRLIAGLNEKDRLSIQFPLTFKENNGNEIIVNSIEEVNNTITAVIDQCDEDDDDDYNDDDYTKESLDALLVECPWSIIEFEKSAINQIDHYAKYVLVFSDDNIVKATDEDGNMVVGEWNTRIVANDLVVEIHFNYLEDFNKQWHVYEIKKGKVKFYTKEQSKIVLITDCQIEVPDKNPLRDTLLHCEWLINSNKAEGQIPNKLIGYKLVFNEDQTVVMSGGQIVSEGNWNIMINEQENVILAITMNHEQSLHYAWPLEILEEDYLIFSDTANTSKLEMQRVCNNNEEDPNVVEIRNSMLSDYWHIYGYIDDERDLTQEYEGDVITFLGGDKVSMELSQATITNVGLWRVSRNVENLLIVYLNFDETSERTELNGIWEVVEYTANHLLLTAHNEDGTLRNLTLQK
ncbi:hypothetical protein GH721_17235 [Kriegella sp. EG-1]|nr:hypothetical protein [Flavobacteriaceae bacterium EG-1]